MMKKIYALSFIILLVFSTQAQIINFPDANFKAKLLAADPSNIIARNQAREYVKIDTNADNEIDANEAALIYELVVFNFQQPDNVKISDISGISAFYNLRQLGCSFNLLQTMDLTALTHLESLVCDSNQLTSINMTGLIMLRNIYCQLNNLTQLDVSSLTNLNYLQCNDNHITSIDISNNHLLTYLHVSSNNLTSLDLTGTNGITTLQCMYNDLEILDLSNQYNLATLMCGYNPNLKVLMIKNGKNETGFNLLELPNMQYICVDESQLTFMQAYAANTGSPNCHVNSYCSFMPGGVYYKIQGTAKYDMENAGCDASNVNYPNLKLAITSGSSSGNLFSNAAGNYLVPVGVGSNVLTPVLENTEYFSVSPTTVTALFPSMTSPLEQNFCIVPNGLHRDVEVTLLPVSRPRPGFDIQYRILFKNHGTHMQSGSINLAFDDAVLDFVSADTAVSSQSGNSLNWNFTDLLPFETRAITLTLNLNSPLEIPAVNSGDMLTYTASIITLEDETPENNIFVLHQTVVNSFDPNDKTCLEGNTITPEMVGKEVHYMIRFENTGTANAQNIVVKDMIDTTKFDLNSLIPLSGSHAFVTKISGGNKVEFIFEDINLPFDDANNDGYVAFKIKTKPNLVVGDTFSNSASIYFDYNFPIITNTATTTVALLANADFAFEDYFKIYPVPVKDVLNIEFKKSIQVSSIQIYNTLGQLVLTVPSAQQTKTVDVSSLKTGNYLVKINSEKGSSSAKFVKL